MEKDIRTKLTMTVECTGPKPQDCFRQEDYIIQAAGETDEEFMKRGAVVLEVMRHRAGHG